MFMFGMFASALSNTSAGADPRMSTDERAEVLRMLRDSEREFLEAIADLTEAQWNHKPDPLSWSVAETGQHIALAEQTIFSLIEKALAREPTTEWEAKTAGKNEVLQRLLLNRTGKASAPEPLQPHGQLTREDVIKRFKEVRAQTFQFAETTELALKQHTADNPFPVFGTLNAHQWLMYIPLHHLRHVQQIAEVKASPRFPG
jgi:hypothetical protein